MEISNATREPQYSELYDIANKHGVSQLGLMANGCWNQDPKRVLFSLSRYKFVAKMLEGLENVLEIGCADAFFTRIVQQTVGHVTAIDFDPVFIEDAKNRLDQNWPITLLVHDILSSPPVGMYDGIFSLDVLEHIPQEQELTFILNAKQSLNKHGVLIIGMPSIESQEYASPQSKAGHVNCKSGKQLKHLLADHFNNVFIFSMNDEVVHTGFQPLAHYLIAVCCSSKDRNSQICTGKITH